MFQAQNYRTSDLIDLVYGDLFSASRNLQFHMYIFRNSMVNLAKWAASCIVTSVAVVASRPSPCAQVKSAPTRDDGAAIAIAGSVLPLLKECGPGPEITCQHEDHGVT